MRQKRLVSLSVLAAIGLIAPVQLFAFGLGPIKLNSALNQQFDAEIEVTSLTAAERNNLTIRLAPPADFERAGLERHFFLSQLQFEIVDRDGGAYVRITSDEPIREPFMDFLVSASAGEGRMIRAYTILLDPPPEVYARNRTQTSTASTTAERPAAATTRSSEPAPARLTDSAYRVQRNETLWRIANHVKPASVSAQQMMIALFEENPHAFQDNNINKMLANVQLTIPDAARATRITSAEAIARINAQMAAWQQPVQTVTTTATVSAEVNDAQTAMAEVSESETTETIETASAEQIETIETSASTADTALPDEDEEDTARLRLVTADDIGLDEADPTIIGLPELQKLTDQLTLAQETLEAQSQENIDFKLRMNAMEEQIETMRRLLSLQDTDLARLQQLLQQENSDMTEAEALAILSKTATQENESLSELVALHATQAETWQTDTEITDAVVEAPTSSSAEEETTIETGPVETTVSELIALHEHATTQITGADVDVSEVVTEEDVTLESSSVATMIDEILTQDSTLDVDAVALTVDDIAATTETAEITNTTTEWTANQAVADVNDLTATTQTTEAETVPADPVERLREKISAFVTAYLMPILLGSVVILLLLWIAIRRRSRYDQWQDNEETQAADSSAQSVIPAEAIAAAAVVATVDEEPAAPVRTTQELIEQADMFVGYADYVQARNMLEQALAREPANKTIATKLLFVLFKQQKSADFLSVLSETDLSSEDEQWQDIAGWGHQLMPNNALFFTETASEIATEEVAVQSDDTAGSTFDTVWQQPEVSEFIEGNETEAVAEADDDSPIEFNLEQYAQVAATHESTADDYQHDTEDFLEFDTGDSRLAGASTILSDTVKPDIEAASLSDDELSLSLGGGLDETVTHQEDWIIELDLDEAAETKPDAVTDSLDEPADLITDALEGKDFDYPEDQLDVDFDWGDFDQIDEAQTKLDLANAYIDMEDPEGARIILEEVLSEGSDAQKQQAQDLLSRLS